MFDHLTVADGLHGGSVLRETTRQQLFGFSDQPALEHFVHPRLNALVQVGRRTVQAEELKVGGRRFGGATPRGSLRRKRLACKSNNFHGPNDAPRILSIDGLKRDWIGSFQ